MIPPPAARSRGWLPFLIVALIVLLIALRSIASYAIEYQWWQEMGQLDTWFNILLYGSLPTVIAALIAWLALSIAHARGLKFAGSRLREFPLYGKLATVAMLLLAVLIALAAMDTWTAVRFFGGRSLGAEATAWRDPAFGHPLSFYLFELPFYSLLLNFVLALSIGSTLVYWLTARLWQLRRNMPDWRELGSFNLADLRLTGALESRFLRALGALLLFVLAARFYLNRYGMLLNDHGFMVGIDWVNQNVSLPLQWILIAACVLAGIAILILGRARFALLVVAALVLRAVVPSLVSAAYVRPNEISLQRPFIARHIQATRAAYGLDRRVQESEFTAKPEQKIDLTKHQGTLQNVRLWDWRAFHDTVSQIQPLRPYVFSDTDVDRYTIDGQLRQVLLAPRELDVAALGEARTQWINPHFIYTHGYGLVMAEANRITANGLPELFIKDAPPLISTPSLKLTRPEIYYGEIVHEPVFVRTAQPEFNYPSGSENVHTRYEGKGGFPISSVAMRAAAALENADWNILLTSYLTPESRMMIRRKITDRVNALAPFLLWDSDPYLVLTDAGKLVWIIDGYMTSGVHPYSRAVGLEGVGSVNYIRNSVKATVDAYDGSTKLFIFDPADPLVQAYHRLFPQLFQPASDMPADLRRHARYPETMFAVQAEIYRTFHMRDPENFYNKADLWDIAKFTNSQAGHPQPVTPTYVVTNLPGQDQPEFLLMMPFTPRNRDNLIGLMMARCDGDHLGEMVVLQLSKQEVILGPMQIEARINQDQNISKDLTLWNQQGSQVVRGQMLVLPIDNTFLYVEPIYIQASEARMPQLKKIALAMGNNLIYTDTYEQALAQLTGMNLPALNAAPQPSQTPVSTAVQTRPTTDPGTLNSVREHFKRYQELQSQGHWADAGKELEAIQKLLR